MKDVHELLHRNLQEVFGEGDPTRRRAPSRSSITETGALRAAWIFVGTTLSTNSPETFARRTAFRYTPRAYPGPS